MGAIVYALDVLDASQLSEPVHGGGWYEWDDADYFSSRWMGLEAQVLVHPDWWRRGRFATLPVLGEVQDGSQVLAVVRDGQPIAEFPVLPGWHVYDFVLPAEATNADRNPSVVLRVNRLQPADHHPSDPRDLGIRVGTPEVHDDARRHEKARVLSDFCSSIAAGAVIGTDHAVADAAEQQPSGATASFFERNTALNQREFESGATVLASFPLNLGIDLYGKCNIKPPCVYCQWDDGKAQEGDEVNSVVDDETLRSYGEFFDAARAFINCSIGEPLLHPRLPQILDLLAQHGKLLEIATNGQAFTPATVRALAGRDITLHVSLDAASADTYARLRNDRWHDVLAGLIALRDARRYADWLPRVYMVFMPMRANLRDFEGYFKLCRLVGAHALVLRPLIQFEHTDIKVERGGYHFDYAQELLTRGEVQAVIEQSCVFSTKYGVAVSNQFGFGTEAVSPVLPA